MCSDPKGLLVMRDKALKQIQEGEKLFKNTKDGTKKFKAYQLYKKGISLMITYARSEKNPELLVTIKHKLEEWLGKAEEMQHKIPSSMFEKNNKELPTTLGTRPPLDCPEEIRITPKQPALYPRNNEQNNADERLKNVIQNALLAETPDVKWSDIVGLEQAKRILQEAVVYPIKFPQLFTGMRTPWKGILLYGPPGTGKTFLAKACATEARASFFSVSSADIMSKYVGDSEKLVKNLFTIARQKKPSIIFIDEIDSLLSARTEDENEATRRVKTEFLVQMEGVGNDAHGVLVLGATNIPWNLDSAVRRRFEKRVYIPLPDAAARQTFFISQFAKNPNSLRQKDIEYLAMKTKGYSGADISILVRDSCYEPLRQAQNATHFKIIGTQFDGAPLYQACHPADPNGQMMNLFSIPGPQLRVRGITLEDFEIALQKTKPSVGWHDLIKHEQFTRDFGIDG